MAGKGGGVQFDAAGVEIDARFSGHLVEQDLTVTAGLVAERDRVEAQDEATAAAHSPSMAERLANPELLEAPLVESGLIGVGSQFDVTATDSSGSAVHEFPNDVVSETAPVRGEYTKELTPGVSMDIKVDPALISGLDPASIGLYWLSDGVWVRVPSVFDPETNTVRAELDHLSAFWVMGQPWVAPTGPKVVLDPDDNYSWAYWPGIGYVTEVAFNILLAQDLKIRLYTECRADVHLTRENPADVYVSPSLRAQSAVLFNSELMMSTSFWHETGALHGTAAEGGSLATIRPSKPNDLALADLLLPWMRTGTGRPSYAPVPYVDASVATQFASVPGTYSFLQALQMDNTFDADVMQNRWLGIVGGAVTAIKIQLMAQGHACADPATTYPDRPPGWVLQNWRWLGVQRPHARGADPVSFSTGNLVEQEPLFSLTGPGDQSINMGLTYNSKDGRPSRFGVGWNWDHDWRVQRWEDGGVGLIRGDGATFVFEPDGSGGYETPDGLYGSLIESPGGVLVYTDGAKNRLTFDASSIDGVGWLVSYVDRAGNELRFEWGTPSATTQFMPLVAVTDEAGQRVTFDSDPATGVVRSVTHPDGRKWTLTHNGAGDLVSITDPMGGVRSWTYDASHRIVDAKDATGVRYLHNDYDGSGRVVHQLDAENTDRTIAYDDAARTSTYTDQEGNETVYAFDASSRITAQTDALGQTQRFVYDANDQITKSTDEAGKVTTYSYDASGHMTKKVLPSGVELRWTYNASGDVLTDSDNAGPGNTARTTTYTRDARGLTTSVELPDGTTSAFAYNSFGDVKSITDAAGRLSTVAYDARGNAVSATDASGAVWAAEFDTANRPVRSVDPNGAVTVLAYDNLDRTVSVTDPTGAVSTFGYDANGQMTNETDPLGRSTSYTWDVRWNLVGVTRPDGGVFEYAYNKEDELVAESDPLGQTVGYQLDALYRLTKVTDPNGGEWTRTYDEVGNVLSSTAPNGAVTRFEYDDAGNMVASVDPNGNRTESTYDRAGNALTTTDASGAVSEFAWDVVGQLVGATDPMGNVTEYRYDAVGNQTEWIDRNGNSTRYAYDDVDRLVSVTDREGGVEATEYDAAGQVVKVTDATGRATSYGYDAAGQLLTVTDPAGGTSHRAYDAAGQLVSVTDPAGRVTTYAYDSVGRETTVTGPDGAVTTFEWDGADRQTGLVDAEGRRTGYHYDAAGQLVSVTEGVVAGGPVDASTNVTTSYAYDAVGNMVGMTDPRGNTTSFEFDLMGHVTGETNALGKTWAYRYDERGLLASEKDPLGQRTDYSWRPDARLSRVSYADGAYGEFAYDPEGNQVGMRDRVGITETTLDKEGRPTKVSATRGGETTKQWDLAGRLEEMVLPTGVAAQYRYDDAGRPESTTLKPVKGSDLVESYSWDAASELVGVSRSNGVMTTIGYDPVGRVGSIEHRIPKVSQPKIASPVKTNAGAKDCDCVDSVGYRRGRNTSEPRIAVEQLRFDYAYDKTSNVAEVLKTSGGERLLERFGYDRLSRLTSSTDSTGRTDEYGYDAAGNRTSWRTSDAPDTPVVGDALSVVSSFDAANQLTAASVDRAGGSGSVDIANTYDGNGNRVAQDVTPADGSQVSSTGYRFDAADRLTKVSRPGFSEAFTLDGAGRRVATKTSTGVGVTDTETVFDGLDPVAQTGGAAGDRTMLGGVEMGSDGSVSWKLTDRAGDVVAVTGADGGVVAMAGYSDFGVTKTTGDWDVLTAHSGELSDPTVGMDLYYRRAYDPLTANWGQADPYRGLIGAPQSLNRYAFVNGNPQTLRDVLGFMCTCGPGRYPLRSSGAVSRTVTQTTTTTTAIAVASADRMTPSVQAALQFISAVNSAGNRRAATGPSASSISHYPIPPNFESGLGSAPNKGWPGFLGDKIRKWAEYFEIDPLLLSAVLAHEGGLIFNFGPVGRMYYLTELGGMSTLGRSASGGIGGVQVKQATNMLRTYFGFNQITSSVTDKYFVTGNLVFHDEFAIAIAAAYLHDQAQRYPGLSIRQAFTAYAMASASIDKAVRHGWSLDSMNTVTRTRYTANWYDAVPSALGLLGAGRQPVPPVPTRTTTTCC